jgi:hypothetical protein
MYSDTGRINNFYCYKIGVRDSLSLASNAELYIGSEAISRKDANGIQVENSLTVGDTVFAPRAKISTKIILGGQEITQKDVNGVSFNNSVTATDTVFAPRAKIDTKIILGVQEITQKNINGVSFNNSVTATDTVFGGVLVSGGNIRGATATLTTLVDDATIDSVLTIEDGVIKRTATTVITGPIYDSLAVHLDTLQSHNTRINSVYDSLGIHLDTLQSHNTRINSVHDSLAVHLDTLQSHNTRIIAAYDSLADHLDSLQSHNTRINTVVNAVGDTATIARTNQENRFIRPQGIYSGGTADTLLAIVNDKTAPIDSCVFIFSRGYFLLGTNTYADWPFDIKRSDYGMRVTAGSTSSDYPLFIRNSSNEAIFAVKGDKKVGIRQSSPTAVLEVRGEKTTDVLLLVSNDANATLDSTAFVNKLGEFYAMNIDTINTPTFTTDIASGVGSRVLVIPAGYWVEAIKIIDVGTTAGLTNIQAQQETSTINLITGKTCATGATMLFKTLADHNVYATAKNLTFTATGNSASGMSIVVYLRK